MRKMLACVSLAALLAGGCDIVTTRSGGSGETSVASPDPLWWPPAKIAGRYLAPFLASWAGLAMEHGPESVARK